MTGLLGYTDAPFADIDCNAVRFLRSGLVWPTLKKLAFPTRGLPLLWNLLVVTLPTLATDFVTWITRFATSVFPALDPVTKAISRFSWPLRNRYSRTHVIAESIADAIGTHNCDAPTRQGKSIVFNACELRTGTAFRMSNERFGTWRYGCAPANELRVADAVAASAAYPPVLTTLRLDADVRAKRQDGAAACHRDRWRRLREPRGQCVGTGPRLPIQRDLLQPRHHHRK